MTHHQQQIVRAILDTLARLDGGVLAEALLHGAVRQQTHPPASLADFEAALRYCDKQRWVTGILGRLEVRKWSLSETGAAAHRDLL